MEPPVEPIDGIDLKAKWGIDRNNLPSIGGVEVSVAPWQPAPWDQRIERLPGAPDYDAICPGTWQERQYHTNTDLAGTDDNTLLATFNGGVNPVRLHATDGDIRIAVVADPKQIGAKIVQP